MAEMIKKWAVVDELTALENELQQYKPFTEREQEIYRKIVELELKIGKMLVFEVANMKIIEINPEVGVAVCENGGYCPCLIEQSEDTKCPCKEFRDQKEPGACHCGRFEKQMEKPEKVIAALEMHEGSKGREVSCVGCPYEEYEEYCLTVLHKDALEVIADLRSRLDDAKNGRLELGRKYQALKNERDDLREDVEAQGEIILELNRDLKRCREALSGQGEYKYLGGDLISREALRERIMLIDWHSTNDNGVLHSGATGDESAYVRYADVCAAVEGALAVEAEPVVHAHWVMRGGRRYCSACGTMGCVTRDRDDFWYTVGTKRCPECGAHMDEEVADA